MPYAELNGTRLYYRVQGQGPSLVLIPGMGAGHASFFRQVPVFRKQFRVITYDPRGIGRSSRTGQPYAFRALADDVAGLLDHLGIDRAHVLGQSLGGIVAQELAIGHPSRVDRLILVSTLAAGDAEGTNPALIATFGPAQGAAVPGTAGAGHSGASGMDPQRTISTLMELLFNRWAYRTALKLTSRLFLRPEMFRGLPDQVAAIAAHTTIDRLHLVQARTLVITGDDDHIIWPQASELLANAISGAKLVVVKGGSHGFNLEMAGRFHREVLGFLGMQ